MNPRLRIWLLAAVMGAAAGVATWDLHRQAASPHAEIYAVIASQLHSIRRGDYAAARAVASRRVREHLDTGDFARLLQVENRSLHHARHVEFGPVRKSGPGLVVPVYFVAPDGSVLPAIYTLVPEDGTWRIRSTRVERPDPEPRRLPGSRT